MRIKLLVFILFFFAFLGFLPQTYALLRPADMLKLLEAIGKGLSSGACYAQIDPQGGVVRKSAGITVTFSNISRNTTYYVILRNKTTHEVIPGGAQTITPSIEEANKGNVARAIIIKNADPGDYDLIAGYYILTIKEFAQKEFAACANGVKTITVYAIPASEKYCDIQAKQPYTGNPMTLFFTNPELKGQTVYIYKAWDPYCKEYTNDSLTTMGCTVTLNDKGEPQGFKDPDGTDIAGVQFSAPPYVEDPSNPDKRETRYGIKVLKDKNEPGKDECFQQFDVQKNTGVNPLDGNPDLADCTDTGATINQCGGASGGITCYDIKDHKEETHPDNEVVLGSVWSCPDGSTKNVCWSVGKQPPACDAVAPIAQAGIICPYCPPNTTYDQANDRCCTQSQLDRNGTCRAGSAADTKTCDRGVSCTFGVGCDNERGAKLPAPCLKYLTVEPTPGDVEDVTIKVKNGIPIPPKIVSGTPIPRQYRCVEFDTGVGSFATDPVGFIKNIFTVLLSLAGGVAMLIIIFSGYRLMTAAGDQAKLQGAKETLTSAIVGLLFIVFSLVILEVIGVDILHIPGLGK